jgi:hypothetical protein
MVAAEVRHVLAREASLAGSRARRWITGTRSAATMASLVPLGCDVGGRLSMGEAGMLGKGEPTLEVARCTGLNPVEG